MANVIKFEALEVEVLIGIANESAELVESSARKAVEQAERCGRALIAIKEKLQHGEWSAWLGQNFDYSQEHARRYMTIASNSTRVLNLKDATSIREALRMIADDRDTPKRECKPAVKVIEVAAEIVAADMPAVEVITAMATIKPAKVKPGQTVKPAEATLTIDSGPVEATDKFNNTPKDKWRLLLIAKRSFLITNLAYDCRCLIEFCEEAEAVYSELGFKSPEEMIREGYELEPAQVSLAVAWLSPPATVKPVAAKAKPVRYLYTLGERGDDVIHYIYRHHISKQNGSVVELSGRAHGDTYHESFVQGTRNCKKSTDEVFHHYGSQCNPYEDDDLQPDCNGQYYAKQLDLSCMQPREGGGQYCYFEPGDRCYYDETAMNLILARNAKRLESQVQ